MTTSPLRCIMPKIGGFSFASVPRPRSPFSRRRRPGRFFDLLGFTLMSCHYIDFVAFHFAADLVFRIFRKHGHRRRLPTRPRHPDHESARGFRTTNRFLAKMMVKANELEMAQLFAPIP